MVSLLSCFLLKKKYFYSINKCNSYCIPFFLFPLFEYIKTYNFEILFVIVERSQLKHA